MKRKYIVKVIRQLISIALDYLEYIDKLVDRYKLQNEQFILDFYDEVNQISVRK